MKAPAFKYLKPATLEECLEDLAAHGDDAQVLAGGQSLMPMLNFRLAAPEVLIDIGGLSELRSIQRDAEHLVVGATQTHADIAASGTIRQQLPLLAQAAPHIAHLAIRSRGTIGGSVALADPAAEWPACCLALNAEIELASERGTRHVPADDFFLGLYSTDRQPDELITAIRFPLAGEAQTYIFDEACRRRGDFAIAGLALTCRSNEPGVTDVRIVFFGVGDRPVVAHQAMAALEGARIGTDVIESAVEALSAALEPPDDPAYPADYRRHVACSLLERALNRLAAEPGHAS